MKRFNVNSGEISKILKMHGLIKEQSKEPTVNPDKDKLGRALSQGCIAQYTWFTPDKDPIREMKSGKLIIFGKGSNGDTYYFFPDMSVINVNTKTKKMWKCEFKEEPQKQSGNEVTIDKQSQKDVLNLLAKDNWRPTPVPSKFQIDSGEYEYWNLKSGEIKSGENISEDKKYSGYFPEDFFVYRKTLKPETIKKVDEVKLDVESCKNALRVLELYKDKPNNYANYAPKINDYVKYVQKCAEFAGDTPFRISYNKRLKSIAGSYGININ